LDITELQKYDTQEMYKVYDQWATIAKNSYMTKFESLSFENIDHIVFVGMGGSGTIGDLFSSIFSQTDIHISIVKGYFLPKTVDKNTLVIVTSISGNTVEVINVLKQSLKHTSKIACFTAGGKIETMCKSNNITYYNIPKIHSPRASFTAFLYSMLNIMKNIIPLTENDVLDSIAELSETCTKICSSNITKSNIALLLCDYISGIPLIYYPFGLKPVATRLKNCLQENAKTHAITENIIEASHNGITAWEKPTVVQPILIKGFHDNKKTKERWSVWEKYFQNNNINFFSLCSRDSNILSKIINMIYIVDYATIYYSAKIKVDPSPVESIMYVKKNISDETIDPDE